MAKAKLITAEDREQADDAEVRNLEPIPLGDADSEGAWDDWIRDLKDADTTGTIRAHRLPVDADGNPLLGKGTRQILWGSWPHQLYTFDDLLAKLTKEFLKPGEIAFVKLTGTAPGVRGVMFSRVVSLQKSSAEEGASGTGESVGQLMKLLQESQDRQLSTLRDLIAPPAPQAPGKSGLEVAKDIAAIVTPLIAPVIAAYVARPAVPKSDLGELLGVMMQMKDFVSGTTTNDNEESTTLGIVKAVAPALPQLLQILAPNQSSSLPVPPRPRLPRPNPATDMSRPSAAPLPSTPPASQPEIDPVLAQMKPQLDQLAQLAEQNADPEEVAKLTVQMVPDQFLDQLATIVGDPASFNRLSILSPALKAHSTWFEKLRVALEKELFEDDGTGSVVS